MDFEENEGRNNCAGEGQQQFKQASKQASKAWRQDEQNGVESPVVK
jgi:hypothetical protein